MANILSDLPGCSTFDKFIEPTLESVCFCCLAQNVPVIDPFKCSHTDFIELYLRTHLINNKVELQICYTCHYMLKKIEAFRKQIHQSYNMLSSGKFQLTSPVNNWKLINNLQRNTITEIENFKDIVTEYTKQKSNKKISFIDIDSQSNDEDQKSIDVKIKVESISDTDDRDQPFQPKKVKKSKPKRKKVNIIPKNSIKKPDSLDKIYEGRIQLVILSKDELLQERETEKQSKSYTKMSFKCEDCVKGFNFEASWKSHMDKFHFGNTNTDSIVCEFCKTVFSTNSTYNLHYKRHFRRYICVVCSKRSGHLPSLAYHYNKSHTQHEPIELQFQCTDCDFTTDSHRQYRYHQQKHKAPKVCEICKKTFVSTSSYNLHMNNIHSSDKKQMYKCEHCPRVYQRKASLYMHQQAQHSVTGGGYCDMCDQNFMSAYSYRTHMKMATAHVTPDVYKFICNDCGKKFKWRSDLIQHIDWEHLKNFKYRCKDCDKVFQSNKSLTRHTQIVHQKIKPPKNKICDFCGKGFTTLSILRTHIRRHTGERPLHCQLCEATFAHDAALYNHKRLVHKIERKRDVVYGSLLK